MISFACSSVKLLSLISIWLLNSMGSSAWLNFLIRKVIRYFFARNAFGIRSEAASYHLTLR